MKITKLEVLSLLLIAFSVAVQIHCAVFGLDLTDEGYLMSLFKWAGYDLRYAQGTGGYPLTVFVGSKLMALSPESGILGMRLIGVVMIAIMEIAIYLYLRRFFSPVMVAIGITVQAIFVAGDPKPFGYNLMTIMMCIVAITAIVEGSTHRNYLLLFGGGLVLGVNVFVRLPNAACMALATTPFLISYQKWNRAYLKDSLRLSLIILAGFCLGVFLTWQLLVTLGYDTLVTEFFASITGTLNGTSTHGSSALLSKYIGNYAACVWLLLLYAIAVSIVGLVFHVGKRWLILVGLFVAFQIVYRSAYMTGNILGANILAVMNGIGIVGTCYYLDKSPIQRLLAYAAVLCSVLVPLGSDGGYQTMWVGTWLSLPIGMSGVFMYLSDRVEARWKCSFEMSSDENSSEIKVGVSFEDLRLGFLFCLVVFMFAVLVKVERKAYYDPGSRFDKLYSIESPLAKGIYTVKKRAEVLNPLLRELPKYVKPYDELLVYDSAPLLYYLTNTRPFAGISWPCVFYGQPYADKLEQAEQECDYLPVVVVQHFRTSNEWSKVLPDYYDTEYDTGFSSWEMSSTFFKFLARNGYRQVWSNGYFEIMVPRD